MGWQDWLVWIILALLIFNQVVVIKLLNKIIQSQKFTARALVAFRARQSPARNKRSDQLPHIDARARTVRRDTHDLPATGRMGTTMKKRSEIERPDSDA